MKSLLHTSRLLGIVLAATAAAETPLSVVRFVNQDFLPGHPVAMTPEAMVWSSPHLAQPASFLLNKILDVSLPPGKNDEISDHEATITLTNGDVVRGRLAGVSDEIISLDTWFAGRIDFRRSVVANVEISQKTNYLFHGPTGMDNWRQTTTPPAWTYRNSSFIASAEGGIAHDKLLPDDFSLSFDTAWRGDSIRLKVVVFADDIAADAPSEGYELSFMRGGVHVRNLKTQAFIGSAQSREIMENEKVRIEIRGSAKSQCIALFINDRIIEVWNNLDVPLGRGVQYISSSKLPMRISDIRVSEWDGELEQMPQPEPGFNNGLRRTRGNQEKTADAITGRMKLANGDTLLGEVSSIKDGLISIKTPLGNVELPLARLRSLILKPAEVERVKRYSGDVRAWFPDGGSIVFRLEGSTPETLIGFSQNFGTATFQTAAFSRIDFNIYSPVHTELRDADDF
jgi:hypothetical protein